MRDDIQYSQFSIANLVPITNRNVAAIPEGVDVLIGVMGMHHHRSYTIGLGSSNPIEGMPAEVIIIGQIGIILGIHQGGLGPEKCFRAAPRRRRCRSQSAVIESGGLNRYRAGLLAAVCGLKRIRAAIPAGQTAQILNIRRITIVIRHSIPTGLIYRATIGHKGIKAP